MYMFKYIYVYRLSEYVYIVYVYIYIFTLWLCARHLIVTYIIYYGVVLGIPTMR